MAGIFPDANWLSGFIDHLNSDPQYAKTASNWEGDMVFAILADGPLENDTYVYLDLWHGKCRSGRILTDADEVSPAYTLSAPYSNFVRVVTGDLDPMQDLLTRKLGVKGNMGYLMRNVPVVLKFVKCAQAATDNVLGVE